MGVVLTLSWIQRLTLINILSIRTRIKNHSNDERDSKERL